MGFRGGKGTAEAIYVLKEVIRKGIEKEKGKIIICSADMKAAFDRLKREKIWERLEKKGVNEKKEGFAACSRAREQEWRSRER